MLAAFAAPLALAAGEGEPAKGGARNPSPDPRQAYTRETEFIANNSTYGTRLSNKSDNGGGAVYGCRSKAGGLTAGNEPCLRASNLADGNAFEFNTVSGVLGGLITVGRGGDGAKPFTTNATGVATGLNADRVDGRDAADFLTKETGVAKDGKAADADKLDGRDSTSFASAGDLLFARVTETGTLSGGRGATSSTGPAAGDSFVVTFDRSVTSCSFTATQNGTATDGVELAAAPGPAANQVTVDQDGGPVAFHLQVIC